MDKKLYNQEIIRRQCLAFAKDLPDYDLAEAEKQIRRQIMQELKADIYAAETIEHSYGGGKCEYIRVIDLSNILDVRLGEE